MSDFIDDSRTASCEVKTIKHSVLCKCGNGTMVGTGAVRLANGGYEHEHSCEHFVQNRAGRGCGAREWFPTKYPFRCEVEVPLQLQATRVPAVVY